MIDLINTTMSINGIIDDQMMLITDIVAFKK